MARLVEKLTRAGPDWRHLIRDFCQRAKDDYSFAHPNERYSESEFWLPGLHSERPGRMVFAVDTSGSTEAVVGEFLAQAQVVLDEFRPEQMDVFWCDAAIQKHEVYYPGDDIPKDAPGGGGTDFRPVFEAVKDDPPVCLVYLTDLEGSFPDVDPGIPTLWVVWGGCKDAPTFGDVAHVEDK
jgi:predicted metal-dependent peptidase